MSTDARNGQRFVNSRKAHYLISKWLATKRTFLVVGQGQKICVLRPLGLPLHRPCRTKNVTIYVWHLRTMVDVTMGDPVHTPIFACLVRIAGIAVRGGSPETENMFFYKKNVSTSLRIHVREELLASSRIALKHTAHYAGLCRGTRFLHPTTGHAHVLTFNNYGNALWFQYLH